jgi:hypothetical protein
MVEMLVRPEELNELVSHMPNVRAVVAAETESRGAKAKAKLAEHRDRGDSKIDVFIADVDGYIVLDDSAGLRHAMSIEYGTKARDDEGWRVDKFGRRVRVVRHRPATNGVGALRAAAGG